MATPSGRVLALAKAARRRPTEHRLNTPAQPRGGLGLRLPDRLEDPHDKRHINVLHGERSEHRIDIGAERARPLGGMLCVLPSGFVRGDVVLGALLEGHCPRGVELRQRAAGFAGLNRINSIKSHATARTRALKSFGETNRVEWP